MASFHTYMLTYLGKIKFIEICGKTVSKAAPIGTISLAY